MQRRTGATAQVQISLDGRIPSFLGKVSLCFSNQATDLIEQNLPKLWKAVYFDVSTLF
jgi:hypothetical protein